MLRSARNNAHCSTACENCRALKKRCTAVGPTCTSCASMGLICERKPERDGRRARSAELEALKAANAALNAEVCALHALVYALRRSTHPELTYQMLTAPVRECVPNGAHAVLPEPPPDAQAVQNAEAGGTSSIAPQVNAFGPLGPPLFTGRASGEEWST
ncbi:hypothetical protein AURDEDRAFT_178419 [Auricularia subglabra TFB-10046 SS5]|uniref:Zn(2)-C6 fungal-type domain-containing protein n=1 Tax=Auricularia subglabra (strain TFB-10046 / SS5) TaxID=717982 RepID=J0WJQ4_AURST|nr:hypothetical protein AURDEDRAFT_178419 [Auricularia subglabra TFB-10046 SS5]